MFLKLTGLADKTMAVLRRDLLTAMRYRSGFAVMAAGSLLELAAFYYLSRAIGPGFRPEGVEYFPFLLVGTGFYTFMILGIHSFLQVVQEAQQSGTLEVLMTTATPPPVLIFMSALSAFSASALQMVIYVGTGLLLFRVEVTSTNVYAVVVVFLLSLVIAVSLGMMAAALQLATQKGSAMMWLLGSGAWLLTGTLFPVGSLPQPLRILAQMIPLSHSLTGMRMALLQGEAAGGLTRELAALIAFSALLVPLSGWLFSHALQRARQWGTLSCY